MGTPFPPASRDEPDRSWLRQAVDASGEIVFMTDREGIFTYVNPSFERRYGYGASEVVGLVTPRILKGAADSSEQDAALWQQVTAGQTVERSFVNRTKDGRLVAIDATVAPLWDEAKTIVGFLATQRDVTARKLAEEKLRAQQTAMELERDLSLDGILVFDDHSRVQSYNRRFVQMWGISAECLETKEDTVLLHAVINQLAEPARFIERIHEFYNRRNEVTHDEVALADGRIVDRYSVPTSGTDARYYGRVWYFRDVTERKRSEATLRIAEERMRFALQYADLGIWDMDYTTGVLRWSETTEAHHGLEPGTFPGTVEAYIDCVHPDDRASVIDTMAKAMKSGADFSVHNRAIWPDGTVRWLTDAGRVVLGEHGEPIRGIGISMDLTARKKLELELLHSQKLESVGRLAAGVAHEINTPVQFVSDSVHFVKEAVTDLANVLAKHQAVNGLVLAGLPAQAAANDAILAEQDIDLAYVLTNIPAALDRSIEGLNRVTVIVQSMKEFAHPGRPEMAPVDLNRAIQSTLTIARGEYKYVAEVETDFGDIPPVTCHGGDVNQVLLNIIVNAAHAIGDRIKGTTLRGLISIQTRLDGDAVVVRIADDGGGIPEAIRNRVFDPFFTTKEVGKGTGQGLTMARAMIVDKHGGGLTFETKAGHGTTFVIRLPVSCDHEVVAAVPVAQESGL